MARPNEAESSAMARERDLIAPNPQLELVTSHAERRQFRGTPHKSSGQSPIGAKASHKERRAGAMMQSDPVSRQSAYHYLFDRHLADDDIVGPGLYAVKALLDLRLCHVHPGLARYVIKHAQLPSHYPSNSTPIEILQAWDKAIPNRGLPSKRTSKHEYRPSSEPYAGLDAVLCQMAHQVLFNSALEGPLEGGRKRFAVRAFLNLLRCGVPALVARQLIVTGRLTVQYQRRSSLWARTDLNGQVRSAEWAVHQWKTWDARHKAGHATAEHVQGNMDDDFDFSSSALSTPGPETPLHEATLDLDWTDFPLTPGLQSSGGNAGFDAWLQDVQKGI